MEDYAATRFMVGVYRRETAPTSVRVYTENLLAHFPSYGVQARPFTDTDPFPAADIFWDPNPAGAAPFYKPLLDADKPLVVTVHGAGNLSLPPHELRTGKLKQLRLLWNRERRRRFWQRNGSRVDAVITVSKYARQELNEYLDLTYDRITPIYHGVNHDLFQPDNQPREPYLLHVSAYQPKKNVDRIVAAYQRLSNKPKPPLLLVTPGYPHKIDLPGIEHIREKIPQTQLVKLYQQALAFVFPSLQESFGMPIVEAMACGCPVITSNSSACAEVAGDAALLVDPRSVEDIAAAMARIIKDGRLRAQLSQKAVARAAHFSWQSSAQQHIEVFEKVLGNKAPLDH